MDIIASIFYRLGISISEIESADSVAHPEKGVGGQDHKDNSTDHSLTGLAQQLQHP